MDQYVTLPQDELLLFAEKINMKSFTKGQFFTQIGDSHDNIAFVQSGVFKVYYLTSDGRQVTRNFCTKGKPVGSYVTILQKKSAHVNIQATEDSVVHMTTYSHLQSFFTKGIAWECLGRKIAEEHYISREKREHQLLTLDATQRYQCFKEDFPGLENRVNQGDIASYLGIDPATLSRIRRKS